ncbi:MAG: hypothetical protein AAFN74_04700 [Myxococcota bacterium]
MSETTDMGSVMPERLTDALVQKGLVSRPAAQEAIDRLVLMGGALDTCLLELQIIDEQTLTQALADAYGMEAASPEVLTEDPDDRATRAFPEQWAKKHVLAPLDIVPGGLRVLTPAPADLDALQRLGELLELDIHPVLAPEFRVRQRLQRLYGTLPPERFQALLDRYGCEPGEPASSSTLVGPGRVLNTMTANVPATTTLALDAGPLNPISHFGTDDALLLNPTIEPESSREFEPGGALGPSSALGQNGAVIESRSSAAEPLESFGSDSRIEPPGQDDAIESLNATLAVGRISPNSRAVTKEIQPSNPVRVDSALPTRGSNSDELPHHEMSFGAAIKAVSQASDIDEVVQTTVQYAQQWLRSVTMLRVDGEAVVGWHSQGPEADRVHTLRFEIQEESALKAVIVNRSKYLGPLPSDQVHSHFAAHLNRPLPKMVLVLPVAVQNRTIALLYADNGEASISPRLANDLMLFLTQVQATLEAHLFPRPAPISTSAALIDRFDQEITLEAGPRPPSTTPISDHASLVLEDDAQPLEVPEAVNDSDLPIPLLDEVPYDPSEEPSFESTAAALASRVSVLHRNAPNDDEQWVSETAPNSVMTPAFESARSSALIAEDEDGTDLNSVLEAAPDDERDEADEDQEGWTSAATDDWDDWVSSAIEETRPVSAPSPSPSGRRRLSDDATVPDLSAEAWIRSASEVTRAKQPSADVMHRADLPEPDGGLEEVPVPLTQFAMSRQTVPVGALTIDPPFDVEEDVDDDDDDLLNQEDVINASFEIAQESEDELNALLEQLGSIHPAQREAAGEALAQRGPEVLPQIIARFPGVLSVDPFAPNVQLPAFKKCGITLSLLERCGRDAHRHVVDKLDAPKPLHRFFAIYFYSAVYVPEAIPKLIQRLHDEEPRICMLAARTLFSYRDHRNFPLVLDHLHNRLKATSLTARRHAAYLIGLFRDVTAIPDLIQIFERKEKNLHDVVADALAEITKQRLGHSPKRWRAWWSKNRHRSRIEWLLDGLASKDASLRQSASDELKAVTGIDLGFDGNAPRRQREEARQRWLKWWKAQQARRAVTPA